MHINKIKIDIAKYIKWISMKLNNVYSNVKNIIKLIKIRLYKINISLLALAVYTNGFLVFLFFL